MSIVGPRPEAGLRIDVERPRAGGPPWQYRGSVATPDACFAIEATVSAAGDVTVTASEPLPDGALEKARLLLRAAWKHASEESLPPPRHIVRWRGESGLASSKRPR
jgi:hypothetical protein